MRLLFLSDLTKISGLGAKSAEKLAFLGIYNQADLILHLPFRYQDKTKITPIANAVIGDEVLVKLKVITTTIKGKQLICHLIDKNHTPITWRFFNSTIYMRQNLVRDYEVEGFGEIKITNSGLEMFHPEYRILSLGQPSLLSKTLSPVYPLTGGIFQANLAKWISLALENFNAHNTNSKFKQAINLLHHPDITQDIKQIINFKHQLQQYLILEELATRKLLMLKAREKVKRQISYALPNSGDEITKLKLNFNLTNAQQRAITEVLENIQTTQPMRRLLQGDVGCGKTIVAVIAALVCVHNNKQVAIMAPTTILAKQHFISFNNYLKHLNLNIVFLTSKQKTSEKNQTLEMIKTNADIVIGTHALITDEVQFRDLALVIIDEQHKFGVKQRITLNDKAKVNPHQLLISATPIPRSIVMSAYGELDVSVIDEMPKGREKISTLVINNSKKLELISKIEQVCAKSEQVYWVCALIAESENYNANPATQTYQELLSHLPQLKIALVHSKTPKDEKKQIMADFKTGKIDILVATTVIEVGVDVPNASFMVVENAEKMGLANLHQLRGRVGRGQIQSTCVLLYQAPLSDTAKQRLDILRNTTDGFKIAAKDLELRGAGEVLGTAQSGIISFKIADIVRDEYLMANANKLAKKMFASSAQTQDALINRWTNAENRKYIIS
jgi:ATP-dependent DNA helicase RecG